jgi:hypothetical protein
MLIEGEQAGGKEANSRAVRHGGAELAKASNRAVEKWNMESEKPEMTLSHANATDGDPNHDVAGEFAGFGTSR